jgi:hypothetical protein
MQHPDEEKYRRIKLGNAAFQTRVSSLEGSLAFLRLVGFEENATGEALEIPASKARTDVLNETGALLDGAINNPFFGTF